MQLFRRWSTVIALVLLIAGAAEAQETKPKLKIREVVWGFDGKLQPNSFNPVSILLDNQGAEAFDGTLVLQARQGFGVIGARLVTEAYVQSSGERWIQFTPYIGSDATTCTWRLSWRGGSSELPPVKAGQDAFVVLVSRSGLSMGTRGLRNFNEDVFPATVAATSPLASVVLDHVPRWEQPRRQAFSDWLRRGGNLHLLLGSDDTFPEFSDELAMLNNPAEMQSYGAGVVFRHRMTREQLSSGFQKQAMAMEDSVRGIPTKGSDKQLEEAIERAQTQDFNYGYGGFGYGWDPCASLHSHLAEMTRPKHAWWLIYLMSIVYILMIFPGCFLLGRKRFHYVVVYGGILGTAAVFSLLFLLVGRRGYGERTSVNSVGLAVHLGDDTFDVIQWGNAFVTSGDTYEIRHQGSGRVYSAGQMSGLSPEAVDGTIGLTESGGQVGTSFMAAVPPFSNRAFVARQRLRISGFETKLTKCDVDGTLRAVELEVGEGFQPDSQSRLLLFYGNAVYSASYSDGKISMAARLGRLPDAIDQQALRDSGSYFMYDSEELTTDERYRRMVSHMLAYRFGIQKSEDYSKARLPQDRIRLLAYVPLPDAAHIVGETFPTQQGYVLVSKDIPIETTP